MHIVVASIVVVIVAVGILELIKKAPAAIKTVVADVIAVADDVKADTETAVTDAAKEVEKI